MDTLREASYDDKILSLYARGMTTRDIQAQLQDLYGVEVSAGLISNVTDAVEAERKLIACGIEERQNRSLDAVYPYAFGGAKPYVYFDALVVKVRQEGRVVNKAIHLALGVNLAGNKELLGMGMTQNESAKSSARLTRAFLALDSDGVAESGTQGHLQ